MSDREPQSALLDRPAIERAPEPESAQTPSAPDVQEVRQTLRDLVRARRAESKARAARQAYIVAEYQRGARPADIARALSALADELRLTDAERRRFGVSESSVHVALKVAGVK